MSKKHFKNLLKHLQFYVIISLGKYDNIESWLNMDYHQGDKILHPMHGAGVIEEIKTQKVGGVYQKYYILRIPGGNMTVMIPIDRKSVV